MLKNTMIARITASTLRSALIRKLLIGAILPLIPLSLLAQGTAGTIVGRALDPSGAVIRDASVSVKNLGTNETRSVVTNPDGQYTVPLLPPGTYGVTVKAAGFSESYTGHVVIQVDQTVRVDAAAGQHPDRRI